MKEEQRRVVLRLGGSILFPDLTPNQERLKKYAHAIQQVNGDLDKLVVVVGGGKPARFYIKLVDTFTDAYTKDLLGIGASRLNARALSVATNQTNLNGAKISRRIPHNANEIAEILPSFDLCFCGGFHPGQSTTGVAALTAETIDANLLAIATDVGGIYNVNPKVNEEAEKFTEIEIGKLIEILASSTAQAGKYELIDLPALKIIERSKLPTLVFNGRTPENISKAVNSFFKKEKGTLTKLGTLITF